MGSFDLNYIASNGSSFKVLLAHSPLNLFMNGHFAVCVFLVISGYVLSWSYKQSNNTEIIQQHVVKRYFRLALPVLGICLFIKLLFVTGTIEAAKYPQHIKELSFGSKEFSHHLNLPEIIKASLFSVPLVGNSNMLSVLWTIRIEFLGALCIFAFLFLSHNRKRKIFYALVFVFVLIYFSYHYVALLLAGSVICIYEEKIRQVLKPWWVKIILFIIGIFLAGITEIKAAIPYTIYAFTQKLPFNAYYYFHDVGAVLVFLCFITSLKVRSLFSFKPIVRFGKLTFSVYLVHLPVMYCVGSRLMWITKGSVNPMILLFTCLVSSLLVSFVFYKLVDKPSIVFSKWFAKRAMQKDLKSLKASSAVSPELDPVTTIVRH